MHPTAVLGEPADRLVGALLGEHQHDAVAPPFVVLDDRSHGSVHVARGRLPLDLHLGHGVGVGGVDEAGAAAEAAEHRLHADTGRARDVVERDVDEHPGRREADHRVEDPDPGPLGGLGPGGHRVRARRFHVSGS